MASLQPFTYASNAPGATPLESNKALVPAHSLPQELLLQIFRYLSFRDLAQISGVCRNWEVLALEDSLWKKQYKILDEATYKTFGDLAYLELDFTDAPAITLSPTVKRKFALAMDQGLSITVLTRPKGLTLKKVLGLAKKFNISTRVLEEFGDQILLKTDVVAVTNTVLPSTLGLPFEAQQKQVHTRGCEVPDLLSIITFYVLTYLLPQKPASTVNPFAGTFTRCSQTIDSHRLTAGFYPLTGIYVENNHSDFNTLGTAALYRL